MPEIKCPKCNRTETKYISDVRNDSGQKIAETWYCKFCSQNFGITVERLKTLIEKTDKPSGINIKKVIVEDKMLVCEVCGAPAKPYITRSYMKALCDKHRREATTNTILLTVFLLLGFAFLGAMVYWVYTEYSLSFRF
ncbi:MAG: hypothetical protein AB1765_07355 [Candidatus Hydrogenedentota bacterium]